MADMTEVYEALRKADAAGDSKGAKKLADYIRSQPQGGGTPTEGVTPMAVHPAEMAAEGVSDAKNWFSSNEPEEVSLGQVGGAVAGGAVGGGAAGAVLPSALKATGKVVPGAAGKLFGALGEASSALPLRERVIRGVGGGAAAGGVDVAGRAFGAPRAATLAGEALAGGIGESVASLATSTATKLTGFAAHLVYGNPSNAMRAIGDIFKPNGKVNEAVARKLQDRLFGNPTESYIEGLVSSDNRIAAQEALRKADPSLAGVGPVAATAPTLPGVAAPQSPTAAANALRPASAIYRERMQDGVTAAVKSGKTFSSTPEFAAFQKQLETLQSLGSIANADRQKLLKTLAADRLKRPEVQEGYAKAVDDTIREWGKPAERGGQTGAAAVSAGTSKEVREALRQAYNSYTSRLGMGDIEAKYRNAYSQEMIAKAKDELPHFLYGFGGEKEFQSMARNLARDPQGLPFIQQKLAAHLAQQEPKAVAGEFERLQKVLVDAKLATPTELRQLRQASETVATAVKRGEGSVVSLGQRFQQMLLMTMARNAAAEGGAAAGKPAAEGAAGGQQ